MTVVSVKAETPCRLEEYEMKLRWLRALVPAVIDGGRSGASDGMRVTRVMLL